MNTNKSDRYELIKQAKKDFWAGWASEITPLHVIRQKWHKDKRNLTVNDVVLVYDKSLLKSKYTLAVAESVRKSSDGRVRSCIVSYRISYAKGTIDQCSGVRISRIICGKAYQVKTDSRISFVKES